MNFFKTKPRTPPDIVRGLRDAIPKLESGPPGSETRRKVSLMSELMISQLNGIVATRRVRKYLEISRQ
jgi:calcium binding protein 39